MTRAADRRADRTGTRPAGRRRAAAASLLLALVLAVASLVLVVSGAGATPTRTEHLTATFTGLAPGTSATTSWPVHLPQAVRVTRVRTLESGPGEVRWDVTLCDEAGTCRGVSRWLEGTDVAPGRYDLRVTVAVTDLPPRATHRLDGHVTFVHGADDALAVTRAWTLPLLLAAIAAALVGVLLLLAARRRRDADPALATSPTATAPTATAPIPTPGRRSS